LQYFLAFYLIICIYFHLAYSSNCTHAGAEWVPRDNFATTVLENAVDGGYDAFSGQALYVIRAQTPFGLLPGKALSMNAGSYVTNAEISYEYYSYEVKLKIITKSSSTFVCRL
jgi:hypothetical protein